MVHIRSHCHFLLASLFYFIMVSSKSLLQVHQRSVIITTKELAALLKELGNGTSSLVGLVGSFLEPSSFRTLMIWGVKILVLWFLRTHQSRVKTGTLIVWEPPIKGSSYIYIYTWPFDTHPFFENKRTAQHCEDEFFLWKRENCTTLSRQVLSLEKRELRNTVKTSSFFDKERTVQHLWRWVLSLKRRELHNTIKTGSFFGKERTSQHCQDKFFLWKRENYPALSKLFFDCLRITDQGSTYPTHTDWFFLWTRERERANQGWSIYLIRPPTGSIIDHTQLSCYLQSEVQIWYSENFSL